MDRTRNMHGGGLQIPISEIIHKLPQTEWLCIRNNRSLALLSLIFAAGISVGSWLDIGRPFPEGPDSFIGRLGLADGALVMFYLFLSITCFYERLWLGIALAGFAISLMKSFYPSLVGPLVNQLRALELILWLVETAIGVVFLRYALTSAAPGARRNNHREGGPGKAKYTRLYLAAMGLWAAIFYLIGRVFLRSSFSAVALAYLVLAVISGIGQAGIYRRERVAGYHVGSRQSAHVAWYLWLALVVSMSVVVLYAAPISRSAAVLSWLVGVLGGVITLPVLYRLAMRLRRDGRPANTHGQVR